MEKINDLHSELRKVTANYNVMISKQDAESVNAGLKLKQLKSELERKIDLIENPSADKAMEPSGKTITYKIFGIPFFSRTVWVDEDALFQRMFYLFNQEMKRQVEVEKHNKGINGN